jgi:exosortase/archaeosortase family protein
MARKIRESLFVFGHARASTELFEGRVYQRIILVAAISFIVLPFVTTFNEFLTKIFESLHFVAIMQSLIAPYIVRVVAIILQALTIPTSVNGSYLYLAGRWMPIRIYINWNCIGWQSFVLLAFTCATGLQGPYTMRSKLLAVMVGLEGTFLVNIVRILMPTLLACFAGYTPAIVFHDYMGTLLTLLWMGFFWSYAFENILMTKRELDSENESEPMNDDSKSGGHNRSKYE